MADSEVCNFFSTTEWRERLRRHVSRTWDLEQALSALTDRSVDSSLVELADSTGIDRGALHDHDLGDLLGRDGGESIDATLDDAVDKWQSIQGVTLPEECPHEVEVGGRCVFHADPDTVAGDRVKEAFMDVLASVEPPVNCLVGLTADDLDISRSTVDAANEYPIDLRFAEIGRLNFVGTEVAQDVRASGIVVGNPSFESATFRGAADFSGAMLGIEGEEVNESENTSDVVLTDNFSEFEGDISFRRATFYQKADFKRTRFGGDTSFNSATFGGIAMFNFARLEGGLDLMHAVFDRKADFSKATVGGYAVMNARYTDNVMFNYTTFEDDADFWNCNFEGMVDLWATTFQAPADFRYADFQGHTSVKEAHFDDGCNFSGAQFHRKVILHQVTAVDPIQLTEAMLSKGRIVQPSTGATYYDLTNAVLGDVRLRKPDGSTANLDRFRFIETDFDGFEFSRHRDELRGNWRIDRYSWTEDNPSYDDLEMTYLRAKNGATDGGDSKAASEFFLREMKYRRKNNWNLVWTGGGLLERLRGGTSWVVSWFYNVSCGYGERPLRTGLVSLGIVVGFAFVYWASPLQLEDPGLMAYLTFSFQTLVTLIYGGIPTVEPLYVRLLAAIEAFIGAFLIALFVFALTRSIHR